MVRNLKIGLALLICPICAGAQYGDAYHAPNQMELNRQAAARQQAASDAHFRNIAPGQNKSGTGSSNYNSTAPAFKTAAQQEAERQERIKSEYEAYKLRREGEAENQRRRDEYDRWNQKRHEGIQEDRERFLRVGMAIAHNKDLLDRLDIMEGLSDTFWADKALKHPIDRRAAIAACASFLQVSITGSLDTLLAHAARARLMPFTTGVFFEHLYYRFPGERARIEEAELLAMPYYFGAGRPNVIPGSVCSYTAYPPPAIDNEALPAVTRARIIERFVDLARKYPEQGLIAAGYCRPAVNPFLLYAKTCEDEACRAEMYRNVLHTRIARLGSDYEGVSMNEYVDATKSHPAARRQLAQALYWLSRYRDAELRALSTDDWRAICRAQALHPYDVSTLVRDADYPMAKPYPKLNSAIKNWPKHRGPRNEDYAR